MSCQKRLVGKKAKEKNNYPFQVGLINWIILLISITLWLLALSIRVLNTFVYSLDFIHIFYHYTYFFKAVKLNTKFDDRA